MASKASVTLRGRFAPGTDVGLYPRFGDHFHHTEPEQGAKVSKDGEVTFTGLEEGTRYWIAGETEQGWRAVAMTAKTQGEKERLSDDEIRDRLAQTRPYQRPSATVTGARSTTDVRATGRKGLTFASASAGKAQPKKDTPDEPQPHLRQEDAQDVPQRSATVTGQATPKPDQEPQPRVRQDQIPENTPQRSATPRGEATPKDPAEQQPGKRQEDENGPQRSATPNGMAEPKPRGSAVENQLAKDSAASKAAGATVAKAGTTKADKSTDKGQQAAAKAKAEDEPKVKGAVKQPAAKGKK